MTYEQLQMNGLPSSESEHQPSYRQGSPVNLTALQEKVSAIVTIVTCGARLQELSEKFARAGLLAKIRPVFSQEAISGTSVECSMTLPRWGIRLDGEYGALATSAPRTKGTECSFWLAPTASDGERTKLPNSALASHWIKKGGGTNLAEQIAYRETFPTPTVQDSKNVGDNGSHQFNLHKYVARCPTPQATSWGCTGAREKLKRLEDAGIISDKERKSMQAGNGGKLNPTWVEALMGFPKDWTKLED